MFVWYCDIIVDVSICIICRNISFSIRYLPECSGKEGNTPAVWKALYVDILIYRMFDIGYYTFDTSKLRYLILWYIETPDAIYVTYLHELGDGYTATIGGGTARS